MASVSVRDGRDERRRAGLAVLLVLVGTVAVGLAFGLYVPGLFGGG